MIHIENFTPPGAAVALEPEALLLPPPSCERCGEATPWTERCQFKGRDGLVCNKAICEACTMRPDPATTHCREHWV